MAGLDELNRFECPGPSAEGPVTWQNHNDISNFASKFQISVKFHSNFIFLYFKFRDKVHKKVARLTLS